MDNKTFDVLAWIARVGLPALTALWLTIGNIWNIPYTEPIGASLAAITTFACALLGISSVQYQKKQLEGGKK